MLTILNSIINVIGGDLYESYGGTPGSCIYRLSLKTSLIIYFAGVLML